MKKSSYTRSVVRHNPWLAVVPRLRDEGGFFNLRALIGFTLCFVGVALALFAHFSPVTDHLGLPSAAKASRPLPYMPRQPIDSNRGPTLASLLREIQQIEGE